MTEIGKSSLTYLDQIGKIVRYGTSGFRYDENTMIETAERIGKSIGLLMIKNLIESNCKFLSGVIVTASHNPHTDNGVKILDDSGQLISSSDEKYLETYTNTQYLCCPLYELLKKDGMTCEYYENCVYLCTLAPCETINLMLITGKDTRKSCDNIIELLKKGVDDVINQYNKLYKQHVVAVSNNEIIKNRFSVSFLDAGICTTPEFHHQIAMFKDNKIKNYAEHLKMLVKEFNIDLSNIVVDCANGVGALTIKKIFDDELNNRAPIIVNDDVLNHEALNFKSGSDYLMNNVPSDVKISDKLHGAFDGDADRIIFYIDTKTGRKIITGDNIALLILKYVLSLVNNSQSKKTIKIGVIQTAYSNGGFSHEIDKLVKDHQFKNKIKIERITTATGVKNLYAEAKRFDIGIYFETNGHGSLLVNDDCGIQELYDYQKLFSVLTGDALMNLFGVSYTLKKLMISNENFYNMFNHREAKIVNIKVNQKDIYKTDQSETILLEPLNLVENIRLILSSEQFKGCRIHIRPSGTEDFLRIYVENNHNNMSNLEELLEMIKNYIF